MAINLRCPRCGMMHSLSEQAHSETVSCSCGALLRAPRVAPFKPSESSNNPFAEQGPVVTAPLAPSFNPYQAPQALPTEATVAGRTIAPLDPRLASLWKRLAGGAIDWTLFFGSYVGPMIVVGILGAGDVIDTAGEMVENVMLGVCFLLLSLFSLIQCALVAVRGQSIGKWLVGTKIVKDRADVPPGVWSGVVVRTFVPLVLSGFCYFFTLIDVLFIFGTDRKCIHDQMAETKVLDLKKMREFEESGFRPYEFPRLT